MRTSLQPDVCPSAEAAVMDFVLLKYPCQLLPNDHYPIQAIILIFPPSKTVLMQSLSSDIFLPYCREADGEGRSK